MSARHPNSKPSPGGIVATVSPEGIAAEIGVEPGDILLSINGYPLRDVIDYRFYTAEEELSVMVVRNGTEHIIAIERDYDESLGIEFVEPVFDGMRVCHNNCPFCFVNQMPKGMRRSLYIHDDDYRYSFLLGNFVTLTNLDEADWQRIQEQHLSPLYVSIHATDVTLRRQLLGNPHAGDIMVELRRLMEWGIQVHGQIVLVPGMNDGQALRDSISDLLSLDPGLSSLALVPVGLTSRHRKGLRPLTPQEATQVVDVAASFAPTIREQYGRTWLYPSDELYLLSQRPLPEADFYDDPAQRENGVGLVSELLDDWNMLFDEEDWNASTFEVGTHLTWVCGTLIAPTLEQIARLLCSKSGIQVDVVPVMNHFFGPTVTVSGLLTGHDVLSALQDRELGRCVCLPKVMFGQEGERTLDDMTPVDIEKELQTSILLVSTVSDTLFV